MFEGTVGSRVFLVHCQCANCQRPSTKRAPVPMIDGAPRDVDEFLDAIESNPIPFSCRYCESLIGELVGVTMEAGDVAA